MSSPTPSTSTGPERTARGPDSSESDSSQREHDPIMSGLSPPQTNSVRLCNPQSSTIFSDSDNGASTPSSALAAKRNSRLPDPPFLRERGTWTAPPTPTHSGYGLPPSDSPLFSSQRGSMILYRFADDKDEPLEPPRPFADRQTRASIWSSSGDSIRSLDYEGDSKYPAGVSAGRGPVPYTYDPDDDQFTPLDDEDFLHDPDRKDSKFMRKRAFPWRGLVNFGTLLVISGVILGLFILYPVWLSFSNEAFKNLVTNNVQVNGTGQVPVLFNMPSMIDKDTPDDVKSRVGFDGQQYTLVFSDEFEFPGRTFYPGEDPYWEAVNLWYGVTEDLEWYDPRQVTTRDGALIITMDADRTINPNPGGTLSSTAPFDAAENHSLRYRSGMLQSWNKFCFTTGYIEVAVSLPGSPTGVSYWPGVWTMGNLARPGYEASSEGMWPYSYDSCDVGTFPNQTNPDGQTPEAAAYTSEGQEEFDYELSWLPGQRTSACSCPGSEHPGPSVDKGRGSPEIDVFEARGGVTTGSISQSAQFAPFTHDYSLDTDSLENYQIFDPVKTELNDFRGSAKQQSTSTVSQLPIDGYQTTGERMVVYGFEYWSDPQDREGGYITWVSDGQQDIRLGAGALGPDPEATGGTGVSQRLISEEPMSIVINLGLSDSWEANLDVSTLTFPAEMKVDYVRVYQRVGHENVGCDPKDYPTAKYIEDHLEAYTNANLTEWTWPLPVNSLYNGGC